MTNLNETIERLENDPVLSNHHHFTPQENDDYDLLAGRGRSLYDNLRTQENFSHEDAWEAASNKYGLKKISGFTL